MKKNSLLMIAAAILMTACGTVAQHAATSGTPMYEDGIYSSGPSFRSKVEKLASKAETDALVEKTKASTIYLFGEKKDTVMIPENMSASIRYDKELGSTVVTVGTNPYDWHNNIDPWAYYTPYSVGSSWYWSRHYNPWYGDPWYWNSWSYTPYHYRGWYDPWYYGYSGWYDPWYYGYGGWYDPYYVYMYPHYVGWYGGWDPYWGYHHHHHHIHVVKDDNWHGSRHSTGADRSFTSRVSTRGGIATASRSGRAVSVSSASRVQAEGTSSVSRTTGRTTASRATAVKPSRANTAVRTEAAAAGTATPARVSGNVTSVQNYRRPSAVSTSGTSYGSERTVSGSSVQRPSGTQTYRNSGSTYRSSSTTSRSSYTPNTSRSYSTGSSFSGGSSSRSSGGSYSGGSSRSGSSSSRR
jgi:hypothetical protein